VEITEVRIKLMEEPGERLKAFCSITFDDCFVVRDLKIIDGSNGPFVAMPSRKLTSHCPKCGMKNHLRAGFCNQCAGRLEDSRAPKDADGRAKLYADIAHPINSSCREMIQECVIREYFGELERAKQPGYVSRYDDFDYDASDSPRGKPARFDQPHSRPAEQPHVAPPPRSSTRAPTSGPDSGPPRPHYRGESAPSRSSQASPDHPPQGGGFGAGVFPD
jgi:stage V sporulation protein G